MYLAFSADATRAFVSTTDGLAVRLASIGRHHAGQQSAFSVLDHRAILDRLGDRRGRLDGKAVNETRAEVAARITKTLASGPTGPAALKLAGDEDVGDSVSIADADPAASSIAAPNILTLCQPGNTVPVTTKICPTWKTNGFSDLGAYRAGVPYEDYNLTKYPAAFANASVYNGITLKWQG